MNEYNSAETFNRMFRDSENKGYKTSYTRVNNPSYDKNNQNNKSSNAKVITYLVVGGVILFYTYKNVLKPAAKVVGKVLDLFGENDEQPSVRKYANCNERVFDGQTRILSRKEARNLIKSSSVAREDPMNPGNYIVDY